ncbi:hypothetical protein H6G97_28555 [Nostoc flagelliforme FACHB-838]|uniref:Iron-containing redox enzyme family protein n=1 Tax=Nostoc flagelliforme FACHB-838 TaxID=2692904 RepID=A0ABR8DWQ3_9NOSO|nr:hypothetical protein [Nostoc flagelliforme]MBD2533306.1 hypothetical protein [Nostoc flagelliforme FACHB-838]
MDTIKNYIKKKQGDFEQHPFFDKITKSDSLDALSSVAERISFWVMIFQDVLRLNEARFVDPNLSQVAKQHRLEDGGHNVWFLEDLNKLNTQEPKLTSLFQDDHILIRDAAYALVSEVLEVRNDYERIALLLSIEGTAHSLFENTAVFCERIGYSKILKYFSYNHFNAEDNHESLMDDGLEATLNNIHLSQDEHKGIFEVIDHTYEAFTSMYDGLYAALVK